MKAMTLIFGRTNPRHDSKYWEPSPQESRKLRLKAQAIVSVEDEYDVQAGVDMARDLLRLMAAKEALLWYHRETNK